MSNRLRWAIGLIVIVVSATAAPLGPSVRSAIAGARPLFQMPFPCGESWHASTYTTEPHNAIDWNRPEDADDRVVAAYGGSAAAGYSATGGFYVVITHGDSGWSTYYGHLQDEHRVTGSVKQGQTIGLVGNTGTKTTGSHLHYEQRQDGIAQGTLYANGVAIKPVVNKVYDGSEPGSSPPWHKSANCAPSAVGKPGVKVAGDRAVTVTWKALAAQGPPITYYQVSNGSSTKKADASASSLKWTGLTAGSDYRFKVRACNAVGCGPWSSQSSSVRVVTKPGAPSVGFVSWSWGSSIVTVNASPPRSNGYSAITQYRVEARNGVSQTAVGSARSASSTLTFTVIPVPTTLEVRVRACNAAGCGPWSGWKRVT